MSPLEPEVIAAIDTFVNAFVYMKSMHGPYHSTRVHGLWVMHDDLGRRGARKTEVVSYGKSPTETVELFRGLEFGRQFLCDIHPKREFDERRGAFKSFGFRPLSTEWFFVHRLQSIPQFESDPPVRLVSSQVEADTIPQGAAHKLKIHPNTRAYRIWDEEADYGWVRSVDVEGGSSWVSGLFVRETARRKGYGSALMSTLLREDKELGRSRSVLLASAAGSKLYPKLGYEQIAILQIFAPPKNML